jgi:hypothetical protein
MGFEFKWPNNHPAAMVAQAMGFFLHSIQEGQLKEACYHALRGYGIDNNQESMVNLIIEFWSRNNQEQDGHEVLKKPHELFNTGG